MRFSRPKASLTEKELRTGFIMWRARASRVQFHPDLDRLLGNTDSSSISLRKLFDCAQTPVFLKPFLDASKQCLCELDPERLCGPLCAEATLTTSVTT